MSARSTTPHHASAAARPLVRLAGLAVALLPLIPARGTVEPTAPVAAETPDLSIPPDVAVADAEAPAEPDPVVRPAPEVPAWAWGSESGSAGPGAVHVQAGAVRVVQD